MLLGEKNKITDESLLGQCTEFVESGYDGYVAADSPVSQFGVKARLVKNTSGGALTPGAIVKWDTGSTYGPLKGVGGNAVADTSLGIGVVDPRLSSVAANDIFWLITYGPTKVLSTTGTAIAIGDTIALGAAGRAIKYDAPGSDTTTGNRDRCGVALEAVGSGVASDTLYRAFVDFRV
jgi:hypothetical protein